MGRTRKTGGSGQRQTLPQRGAGAGPSAGARDGRDEHRHGDDHVGKPLVCFPGRLASSASRPTFSSPSLSKPLQPLRLYCSFLSYMSSSLSSTCYLSRVSLSRRPCPFVSFFAPKNFTAESEKARQNGTPKTALTPPKTPPPPPPLLLGPSPFLSFWYVHLLLLGCFSSISFSVYLRVSGAAKAAKLQPKHHDD